ncbi:hypothetical protein HMPREF1981_03214 [Bacteroides pyogenes F0041]|uniref:Uncharacterized protein n=1 Tax=Bacteroides pyogenes F0041 TaxID=1321819 RepID=U2CA82_9BACE|nr:hypothetical protein HMPREF1981_03214 [Bacteroides pyogenes F0041]
MHDFRTKPYDSYNFAQKWFLYAESCFCTEKYAILYACNPLLTNHIRKSRADFAQKHKKIVRISEGCLHTPSIIRTLALRQT